MKRLLSYARNSYKELMEKVSWPTAKELQNSSLIVMVASFIIATLIFTMDTVFVNFMGGVYNLFLIIY